MTRARVIAAVLCAGASGVLTISALHPPMAHAEDPLDGIKAWVQSERLSSECKPLNYNPLLERDAQYYARNNDKISGDPTQHFKSVSGYTGKTTAFMGVGDPKDKVLHDLSLDHADTIQEVWNCELTEYGVGFNRFGVNDIFNNPQDYVTVVLGEPAPPPAPASSPPPQPTGPPIKHFGKITPTPTAPPPAPKAQATVTADVDVYDSPNGTGNVIPGISLHTGSKYDLIASCADSWCHLAIPEAPGGSGWVYQDGFLSVP